MNEHDRCVEQEARIEAAIAVLRSSVPGLHTDNGWKYIYINKINTAVKILEGKDDKK